MIMVLDLLDTVIILRQHWLFSWRIPSQIFIDKSSAQGVSSLLHLGQAQSASSTCTQGLYEQQLARARWVVFMP